MCPRYMCILLYVTLILCTGIPHIYDQLEEGGSACLMGTGQLKM